MKNTLWFLILFVFLTSSNLQAAGHFTATVRGRTLPQSANIIGSLAYDHALWGDPSLGKENPMFGFASVGTRFGGSPTLSGFVQVAPISPLIFEVERSFTHRFTRSSNFPCDSVECKGRIDRTDFSARLGGAWKNILFVVGFLWRDIKTMDSALPVMVELEDVIVTPGNHRFVEGTAYVGTPLDETQTVGVLYVLGEMKDTGRGYQSTFAVYRKTYEDYTLNFGVGNHKSDFEHLTGFSAILGVSRQYGETMSLF